MAKNKDDKLSITLTREQWFVLLCELAHQPLSNQGYDVLMEAGLSINDQLDEVIKKEFKNRTVNVDGTVDDPIITDK